MFLGKWTFGQPGAAVVVAPGTGLLGASAQPGGADRFNAYGTADAFTLQTVVDGRFVARQGQLYAATAASDTATLFTLRQAATGQMVVVDLGRDPTKPSDTVWDVTGTTVTAVSVTPPPTTAYLAQSVVTVGLATILEQGLADEPDLTWVDLEGADLGDVGGILDLSKAVLDHANLGAVTFPDGTSLQSASAVGVDLRRATLRDGILGHVTLTDAHLDEAVLTGVDLSWATLTRATLRRADLSGSNNLAHTGFAAADLTGADLSQALNIYQTDFSRAVLVGVDFTGSSVTGTMDLRGADLTRATLCNPQDRVDVYPGMIVLDASTRFVRATICRLDLTGYDLRTINFSGADLTGCTLHEARLDGANLGYATLDDTTITGAAGLHGANLSGASLRRADLTGAQLGSIGELFRVGSDQGGYRAFHEALASGNGPGVAGVFGQNHVTLTEPVVVRASSFTPDTAWSVQGAGTSGTFSVALETSPGLTSLTVYQPANPAVLSNAFMVDANLSSANLCGVRASGVQLYATAGRSVHLNRATIHGLQANNANLGSIDLSQATISGVNFDYAVLTGANFTGSTIALDSSGGQPSFNGANLQGAHFGSATLRDVILANAAIAVADPADAQHAAGVWLFSLPADQTQLVRPQLDAATKSFSVPAALIATMGQTGPVPHGVTVAFQKAGITLSDTALLAVLTTDVYWRITAGTDAWVVFRTVGDDYRPALGVATGTAYKVAPTFYLPLSLERSLGNGPVAAPVREAFAGAGSPLPPTATMTTAPYPNGWQVVDGDTTYSLWLGFSSTVRGVDTTITARPAIAGLVYAFGSAGLGLSGEATVTRLRAGAWSIDNDAEDPFNAARGYIQFTALVGAGGGLDVYGSMVRIVRSSAPGQEEFVNVPCQTTELPATVLTGSGNTICPNGASVSANTSSNTPYPQWLWARFLASPPVCIPDPQGQFFCPC